MKFASRRDIAIVLFTAGIIPLAVCGRVVAEIAPENVLVLYSDDQGSEGDGFQIAEYYQQIRPGVHVAPISGIDAILTGALNEDVEGQDYLDVIRPQILSAIGDIPDTIDVIVTTKGMPLRINAGTQPAGNSSVNWKPFSSLESEIARIDAIDTIEKMGDQVFSTFFPPSFDTSLASNPYYTKNAPFVRAGSGGFSPDIRLSSRLDGYSIQTVKDSIDRAQNVYIIPFGHDIVVDDTDAPSVDQMTNGGGPGPGLFEVISSFYPDDGVTNPVPLLYDHTDNAIVSSSRLVLGYVSHGSNDGGGVGLTVNYLGEFVDGEFQETEIQFEFANGAVFQTHESFNAQSFDPQSTQNQGLIADWLELGGTAGLGHVAEPNNGKHNVTNEDLFYQKLLPPLGADAAPGDTGLTFVEAAWNATKQLSYVNTVVGDPLMKFQAWLPGDTNLDGVVEFHDFFTFQNNWQQAGSFEEGDFTGDGIVNEDDFNILQQNWLSSVDVSPSSVADISVSPMLDGMTGEPVLDATLLLEANFNGDLNVDGGDLEILLASYGSDGDGDTDGDDDTDGVDFLTWQRQNFSYSLYTDFNIDGGVGESDLEIWEHSFGNNRGGDANGDGYTDGADFLAWQREYVEIPNLTADTAFAVPEPATHMMISATAALLSAVRRRITFFRKPVA